MYQLSTALRFVKGIGPARAQILAEDDFATVGDLLIQVPNRYEDRSAVFTIATAPLDTLISLEARVLSLKEVFSRKRFVRATISDGTGKLTVLWFNNRFVAKNLKEGETYVFSGKINDRKTLMQPLYESATLAKDDHIHTSRLIPVYSSALPFPTAAWRRLLKEITDNLESESDELYDIVQKSGGETLPRAKALKELHFPAEEKNVVLARERLALEELIQLIRHSRAMQDKWKSLPHAVRIKKKPLEKVVPRRLPFELTGAQRRVIDEILVDSAKEKPMNRLLLGDVGSGKTIVAGLVAQQFLDQGHSVAFVAPTRILAEQHANSLAQVLPGMPIELLVGGVGKKKISAEPKLYLGTHTVINTMEDIQPKLVIYDEQHRFGVKHRSKALELTHTPHVLTMTATPIPRTMLLTIFSHLAVSHIDELPANRQPTKTWTLTPTKKADLYNWVLGQIEGGRDATPFQVLVVCPFIEPSDGATTSRVAAAKQVHQVLAARYKNQLRIDLLHGKQPAKTQQEVIAKLRQHQTDLLVTTTIVEVGVDLPQASLMIIEGAERYGLASLHQLRGRVGRAGQQGYCALFTTSGSIPERLKKFTNITNGQQLAELDLEIRGAGDLFGTLQSGFDQLQFASWTNGHLIHLAQTTTDQISADWQSIVKPNFSLSQDVLSN